MWFKKAFKRTNSLFTLANKQLLRTHSLPIRNGQIEYMRFGCGTPVVFINGYSANIASWDCRMLAQLAKYHEVILFNNRNVGKSYSYSSRYDCSALAEDTDQLIQGLCLKNPAILGYSMGGMIAQQLLINYPADVGTLILMSTSIGGHQAVQFRNEVWNKLFHSSRNPFSRLAIALRLYFPQGSRFKGMYALLWHRFIPRGCSYDDYPSEQTLRQQQDLMIEWFGNNNAGEEIRKIHKPTLILSGSKDIVVHPANSMILADIIHQAKLLRWEDGGHAMMFQFPIEIANAISNFLAKEGQVEKQDI